MSDLKRRVMAGILGATLAFSVVACDSADDPTDTTPAGETDTTSPVGS